MFTLPRCFSSCWNFSRKESCVLLFSFADFSKKDLPFSCSILFHWRKAFLRTTTPFYSFIFFWWKNSEKNLPYFLKKKNHPLFITFCFCSSRFAFTSVFHFRFCLIFGFSWSPSSWTHLYFTSLSSVFFQQQQFLLPVFFFFQKKKLFKYPFYMDRLPLDVLLLKDFSKSQKTCLFISFFGALFHVYLFLHVCPPPFAIFLLLFTSYVFLNIFLFCSRSWMFFSVGPFLLISFFWFLCLVWSSFFLSFLLSLLHKKAMCFELLPFVTVSVFNKNCVPSLLVLWERNVPLCFLFLLVFLFSESLKK